MQISLLQKPPRANRVILNVAGRDVKITHTEIVGCCEVTAKCPCCAYQETKLFQKGSKEACEEAAVSMGTHLQKSHS